MPWSRFCTINFDTMVDVLAYRSTLYFRFNGLFAPHWRTDARGTMVGITQYTRKGHICRATLEVHSIIFIMKISVAKNNREIRCIQKNLDTIDIFQSVAFQTWEILNSMQLDSKLELKALLVDGGMTKNELLMQTQADFLG